MSKPAIVNLSLENVIQGHRKGDLNQNQILDILVVQFEEKDVNEMLKVHCHHLKEPYRLWLSEFKQGSEIYYGGKTYRY